MNDYDKSDLLNDAVELLHPDQMTRAVYRRGVCLIAHQVRKQFKGSDNLTRRDLWKKLASISESTNSLSNDLTDPDVSRSLAITGHPESEILNLKELLGHLVDATNLAITRLGLRGKGTAPTWGTIDATPKVLLVLLSRRLFAFARDMEQYPSEQEDFLQFLGLVWELAGGEPQEDFGRQIDNAKDTKSANLMARLKGGDLLTRVQRALERCGVGGLLALHDQDWLARVGCEIVQPVEWPGFRHGLPLPDEATIDPP